MPDNNLDFLDYLNDDGNVNLDQINSFLDQVEQVDETLQDPNEIQGADEDEYQEDYLDSEDFEEGEEENEPYVDGLEFLNSRNKSTPVQSDDEDDEEEYEEDEDSEEFDEDSDEESEVSDNPYAIFAKGLADIGRFEFDEDEDPNSIEWNEDTFIEKFDETVDNTAWARMEELATEAYGEEGIRLIEDLFINKVPVHEYLASFQTQQSVENLDLSNERNQVELVRYYLRSVVGETDEEEIQDQINYMKTNETLEKKAANFQQKLVTNEYKMRERMAAESQARQQQMEEFENQRIQMYSEIAEEAVQNGELNGLPFNNKDYNRVLSAALSKDYVLPNGQKITPFEYKLALLRKDDPVKYLQLVKLVEDDLDLTPVMKKGVTEKTNEIFKGLQNKTKTSSKPKSNKNVFSKYMKQS
jgi:hypothetical protein